MIDYLMVRPLFDEASGYSFTWAEEIIGWLKEKKLLVIDLAKDHATRSKFEEAMRSQNPSMVIFYNHGSKEGLVQQDGEGYVIDKSNDALLKDKEIYTMACLWGADGGINAWKKGAKAVWAYVQVFTFTTEALDEFQEFANSGLKFRLEGKSWKECLQLVKDLANQLAQKLVEAGKYIASVILQGDADALRCYTEDMPPTSDCAFRRLAIHIFGPKTGWKFPSPTLDTCGDKFCHIAKTFKLFLD